MTEPFLPPGIPVALRPKLATVLGSLSTFARLLKVQDKESKRLIPFKPLPMQSKLFAAVEAGHKRIIIVKARQVAATTACKLVLHWMATTTQQESMHAIVSMRDDSATAMLGDNRRWLEHPPKLLRRKLSTKAKGGIVYADTKASLKAFTSRSESGLRSFSPAAAVISEAAFAPDLEEVVAQVDAAVGDGLLMVESTANNPADFFSQLVRGAPANGWLLLTLFWWEHPAYCDPPAMIPAGFEASLSVDELALRARYDLNLGQLHWRRRTEARIGSAHKFRREYPGCLDDCFLDREGGYFEDGAISGVTIVEPIHGRVGHELEAPHHDDRYVMGVDIGGGVGGDFSALCVVSVATRQVVYTERSNVVTPAAWAHRAIQVGARYNQALMLAESNNHGHAFLLEVASCGYRSLWLNPSTGKPWITTLPSKLDAYDTLRESLQLVRILDRVTWMELRSLTIPAGKVAPEAPRGAHDDAAMACALAYRCMRDIPASWRAIALQSGRTRVDDLLSAARSRRLRSSSTLPF